ncbi:Universal stress protein A-like protein [Capsicum chinense]|nr:Universal stress protein A-like protein [Capsicum chinense]
MLANCLWPGGPSHGPLLDPPRCHVLFRPDGQVGGFEDMDSIFASPEDFKGMKNRDKIRGLHLLEYFVNRCHEIGVPCEAWTKKGDPKEIICHEVKRVQPDLLVVGCRGLGPFQRNYWLNDTPHLSTSQSCPKDDLV